MTPPSVHQPRITADPRRPLVLDIRSLGRRPGTMWEGTVTAVAPPGLGVDLIRVPAGAELTLRLRLESVLDGVLVTAAVTAPLVGECGRCLEEISDDIEVQILDLWSYPEQADRHARTAGSDDDQDLYHLDGDELDLEQAVRDAVVLALPVTPLCSADCAGLCSECGIRLDDAGPEHGHRAVDARWAGLEVLRERVGGGD